MVPKGARASDSGFSSGEAVAGVSWLENYFEKFCCWPL
jgi:hypothetical protein